VFAIKVHNGGNPWAPDEIAKAIGIGAKSPQFFYVTAGARDYGLTLGTRYVDRIELTELGREIAYAPNPDVEQKKKIESFLRIELVKKVLDYYKATALPEMKYLGNTLEREFGLPPEYHDEFSKPFVRTASTSASRRERHSTPRNQNPHLRPLPSFSPSRDVMEEAAKSSTRS
jgi:hypothetical protein